MTVKLRNLETSDHLPIVTVVNDWWGGRQVSHLLPKLFFQYFRPTSFVAETEDRQMVGFLVGFISQTDPTQAYIHFVGIAPQQRALGIGRILYEHFFEVVQAKGCQEIFSITSPANSSSQAFHKKMGFEILPGDLTTAGVAATADYDGYGADRVRFRRVL